MTIPTRKSTDDPSAEVFERGVDASMKDAEAHLKNTDSMVQDTMIVPGVKEVKPEQSIDGLDIEDL